MVYSKKYNITFAGLEHFHPLDAHKFKNVLRALRVKGLVNIRRVVRPESASDQLLHLVHSSQYLSNIRHTWKLVKLTEILPLAVVPNAILQVNRCGFLSTLMSGKCLNTSVSVCPQDKSMLLTLGFGPMFLYCAYFLGSNTKALEAPCMWYCACCWFGSGAGMGHKSGRGHAPCQPQ